MCMDKDNKTNNIYMRASRMSVIKWEFRFTFRGQNHQESFNGPKDKDKITSKGGVIYRCKCKHPGCTVDYIAETGKTLPHP